MTKAEAYAQLRMRGLSDREAANMAGFAGGVSSNQARRLYEHCVLVASDKQGCEWLAQARAFHESKIEEHRAHLRDIEAKLRACSLVWMAEI
jgi:hypothetical protein